MQSPNELEQLMLNAFIDGQLDAEQERSVLAAMESDPTVRNQIHRLRTAKDWMRTAFADAEPPSTNVAPKPDSRGRFGVGIAASLIALTFATGGGLIGYVLGDHRSPLVAQAENPQHILLHIDESTPETFATVLDYAEEFLAQHRARGAEVEVVANAGGVDLMRVGGSPYEERVRALSGRYQNLHFLACANAIRNLRKQGVQVTVLDHVNAGESAVDHIVGRIRSGWKYVKASDLPGV